MGRDSRLLIADFVVPERVNQGDDFMIHWMNLSMLMLTGKEKTNAEFERILEPSGLELLKVWPITVGAQSVVEARLKA